MEIKFCLGNITGRGKEVALKFDFDDKLVEQLKKVLNRYRYLFQKQTNMQAWQAGGWLAEKRVWYVRQELWDTVRNELIELGHSFISMSAFEAKRYIQPEEQQTNSNENKREETKSEDKDKSYSDSNKQEEKSKKSSKSNSYYKQNRKTKQEREKKQKQRTNSNYKTPHRVNFLEKDYQLLCISNNASAAEIKQAYRDLVEVWHPDRFSHNERLRKKAEEMLKLINAAYDRIKAVA